MTKPFIFNDWSGTGQTKAQPERDPWCSSCGSEPRLSKKNPLCRSCNREASRRTVRRQRAMKPPKAYDLAELHGVPVEEVVAHHTDMDPELVRAAVEEIRAGDRWKKSR